IDGRVTANDSGAVLDRLVGSIDGEPLAGRVEYTGAGSATERGARLDAALEAGRFGFCFLAGASSGLLNSSGADGANARAIDTLNVDLNIAALMAGSEDLGQVLVNLSSTPERTRVDQLEIGDAAGARLSASGFIEHGQIPPVGNFSVNAELDEIGGLVRLARDLFGESPFLADLQRNRGLYEPMVLTGSYGNQQGEGVQLGITGEIAGTEIDVTGTVQPSASVRSLAETVQNSAAVLFENGSEIRVNARADDAFALIGQLGIPALPPNLSGPGELFAVVTKAEQDAPTFRLAFDGLENTLRVDGELTGDAVSGISGLQGSGSLFVGDVAQVGLMAGIALPGLFEPFSASAGFDVDYARADQRIELSSLEGFVADVPLSGSASVEQTPLGAKIAADLSASEMSLPQVLAGFVGPSAFDQGVEIDWPEGPIAFNPLPADISLTLRSPRLALWDDLTLLGANAQLLARGDELSIESLSGSLKGGDLDARLVVRDTDQGGLLNGRLTWTDIALADMSWRPAGAALVEGTGGITATLESAGNSIRGLLSGLSGDGTIQLTDMTVRGIGVAGFARVLQASDAGLLPEEADLDEAFSEALRASSMRVDRVDTPITVVGGVIRASNLYIEGEQTAIRGGFTLDLAESLVDANFSLAPTQGRSDVSAMPNIGLSFNGPVSRPERALDASQVASFLNVRQLEREIQRVEDLNAEILERETLLRFLAAIELDEARLERLSELRAVRQRRQDAASEAPTIPLPPLNIPDVSPSDRSSIDEAPGQTIGEDEVSELPPLEPPITVESNAVVRVNPLSLGESVPATAPPLDLNPN
ncbi:MAG: AsmA-like C-terminal region-containing protein, partial [Pseudomonadota bacterium]